MVKDWMRPAELAAMIAVAPTTIRAWCNCGKIKFITTPGGHRRISRHEAGRIIKQSCRGVIDLNGELVVVFAQGRRLSDISSQRSVGDVVIVSNSLQLAKQVAWNNPGVIVIDCVGADLSQKRLEMRSLVDDFGSTAKLVAIVPEDVRPESIKEADKVFVEPYQSEVVVDWIIRQKAGEAQKKPRGQGKAAGRT